MGMVPFFQAAFEKEREKVLVSGLLDTLTVDTPRATPDQDKSASSIM